MTHIGPIHIGRTPESNPSVPQQSSTSVDRSHISTLCSAKSGFGNSGFSLLHVPVKFFVSILVGIGKLIAKLFCCFCKSSPKKETLDWNTAKDLFAVIHTAAITSREFKTTREETFYRGLGTLSPAMRERFYQHVGFALATEENPSITARSDQERYYNEHCNGSLIRKQLENIDSPVVKKAVASFQEELVLKTGD